MKLFLILVLFISNVNTLIASETQFKIYGIIRDAVSFAPLSGANLYFEDTRQGSATDSEGIYTLKVNGLKGTYNLIASFVGYHDHIVKINFPLMEDIRIDIPLKESALMMDQIVVTGTRSEHMLKHSPVTTQVIKGKTIKESGGVDLAEVLERVTGVNVSTNSLGTGTSTVELQGFGSEHVLILVDGVKMIGRVRGELDISQIPSSQIERIEIVKGASSTLYGSEAMGGVINIVTRKPGEVLNFNVDTQIGSYGKVNSNINVSGDLNGWQPILGFNYRRSSGFDLDKSTEKMDGTAYDKYQTRMKLNKKIDDNNSFSTQLNYFDEQQSVITGYDFEDIISNNNFASRTEFKTSILPFNFTTGIEFSGYEHSYDKIVRVSGFLKKGSKTKENLIKGDLLFNFDLNSEILPQKLNGGYAYESESIESDRLKEKPERTSTLHNFFMQDELKISQLLTLVIGGRLDAHSEYGIETSPKISVMLSPAYNVRFRASYAHGFRAPSFKELYVQFYNESFAYLVDGNPNLKAEYSKSVNIGSEFWTDNNYHTRVNFFYNSITNLIKDKVLGGADTLIFSYENIAAAKTWGAEWDMEYYPFEWFETGLGYYYLDSYTRHMDAKNKITKTSLELQARHRANLRFGFKLFNDLKINFTSQITGKKFFIDPELADFRKNWIEGYVLFHSNVSFPIMEHFHGQFGVKNLTDYVNLDWGPMPGREFYANLNIDF